MDLMSDLSQSIKGVLTHINDATVEKLLAILTNKGVKKLQDLRHITNDMLKEVLDYIDAADLYEEWQKTYGRTNIAASSGSAESQQTSLSTVPLASRRKGSQLATTSRAPLATLQQNAQSVIANMPIFDAESPYMPHGVKVAIQQKTRPTHSEREDMVNRVVDRCREVVPNLERWMFNSVAEQIVTMCPESFKDTVPISEHGSDSLAAQLKVKFDNDNRNKDKVPTEKEKVAPPVKEAVGCQDWNPSMPEDENEESLDKIMQELIKIHKLSPRHWDWNLIKRKSTSSYYLQRKDINGKLAEIAAAKGKKNKKRKRGDDEPRNEDDDSPDDLTIDAIQQRWPFLFTAQGINIHFHMLTGKDFSALLDGYISKSGKNLIDFLASHSEELLKMKRICDLAERKGYASVTLSALMLMLIKYFKEDRLQFIVYIERTTEFDSVAEKVEFPATKTPLLIFAGPNIFDYDKIFLAADNKVLCTASNFSEGLTLLFTSYFVFNYVYPSELSCFLSFIQRSILGINPLKSSRCIDSRVNKVVNNKILQFSNKFAVFDQTTRSDENDQLSLS